MEKPLFLNNFVHERSYTGVNREEFQMQGFERQAMQVLPLRSMKSLQDDF